MGAFKDTSTGTARRATWTLRSRSPSRACAIARGSGFLPCALTSGWTTGTGFFRVTNGLFILSNPNGSLPRELQPTRSIKLSFLTDPFEVELCFGELALRQGELSHSHGRWECLL